MSMTSQQPLFPEHPIHSPDGAENSAAAPVWLQRLSLIVLVLFCVYIGIIVAVLPWIPRVWDHNAWLVAHPSLRAILLQGWVRGVFSGIGLLDIWVGVSEAIHYRDHRSQVSS
jgi:hypothetical protein